MAMKAALPEIQERRLIIAIDYGTTYTGIAYATSAGNRALLDEIYIHQDWGGRMGNIDRVPSVISYSLPSEYQELQWGASLSPEAIAMVHTKLELEISDTSDELELISDALDGMHDLHFGYIAASTTGCQEYTWKGPEKIVEDYLTKVFNSFNTTLSEIIGPYTSRYIPVYIVVTTPTMWSYRAKNSLFRAIIGAGFNRDAFPQLTEILLLSEPEAAAIYVARYMQQESSANLFKKGECFVLCDAGGATVDVVSYKIKELEPNLELEAVTLATGRKCGSIFISFAFKKWLRALLGDKFYRMLDPVQLAYKISSHSSEGRQMRVIMRHFDNLKMVFDRDYGDMKMDLPRPLDNLSIHNKVIDGELTISNDDMRSFFDPCVDSILELIQQQILQVEQLGNRVKSVFLVGGLAESEYLQQEIQYSLRRMNITLLRPDTSWTAVVRGAAIFGIEHLATRALPGVNGCLRSFGALVTKLSSDTEYHNQDLTIDPITGRSMAKSQFVWFIRKGDLLLSDTPRVVKYQLTKNFLETDLKKGRIRVCAYDGNDVPKGFSASDNELDVIHRLDYDLTDIPMQEFTRSLPSGGILTVYVASLTLVTKIAPPLLTVELCWRDKTLCSVVLRCL